jgi:hypothetical protein
MSSSITVALQQELAEKKSRQEALIERRKVIKDGMEAIRSAASTESQSQLTTSSDYARQHRTRYKAKATLGMEDEMKVAEDNLAVAEKDLKEITAEILRIEELLK